MADIPVYLFTGFLESGKTSLIKQTLLDPEFNRGERTLILACEEGIEEYDEDTCKKANAVVVACDDMSFFDEKRLEELTKKYQPQQVMIEFNGTWKTTEFMDLVFPIDWLIVQIIATVDASTFENYISNMRSFMYEQMVHADLIIINRCSKDTKKSFLRGNVKAINRTAQIIYENVDGQVNELLDDELPFDIHADELTIADDDFGLWYMDAREHPEHYKDKTITLKARLYVVNQFGKATTVMGRKALVCCEQDTSLCGLVVNGIDPKNVIDGEWRLVRGQVHAVLDRQSQQLYLVMQADDWYACEPLKEEYVYFS